MLLAQQAADQYQALQGLQPPTVAVYQATRHAAPLCIIEHVLLCGVMTQHFWRCTMYS